MIQVEKLRKSYGSRKHRVVAVDGVDLHVREGEVFGVLGQSGAGKSTLLRCVNLLERPDEGRIVVDGNDLLALRGAELRRARQGIGMIHQHFGLLSSRTVAGNVAFPLEVMGVPRAERARRVGELLELVGLGRRAKAYPAQLSGGQKQRVGIARALAGRPKVLLSDEATSALDPETTRSILELLRRLNRELNLTVLLITHEMEVVKRICDSVAIMRNGRFTESGRILDLLATPGSELAAGLFPLASVSVSTRQETVAIGVSETVSRIEGDSKAVPSLLVQPGSESGAQVAGAVDGAGLQAAPDQSLVSVPSGTVSVEAALTADSQATPGNVISDVPAAGHPGPEASTAARAAARQAVPGEGAEATSSTTTIVDVTFVGDSADRPFVSALARTYSIDVNILGGSVEQVGEVRVGRLRIELPGGVDVNAAQLAFLRESGLTLDVHGEQPTAELEDAR